MKFQRKFLSLIEKSNDHGHNEIEDSFSPNNIGLSTKLNLEHVSSISKKVTSGSPRISEKSNKVDTEFGIPDARDVLDIFIYCKTHYLSENDGNDLIILIIQLFRRHPTMKTLFLHRNMRSITRSVNRALDSLYFSHEIHATLPYKLRGSNANQRALIERLRNKERNRNPELIIASIGIGPILDNKHMETNSQPPYTLTNLVNDCFNDSTGSNMSDSGVRLKVFKKSDAPPTATMTLPPGNSSLFTGPSNTFYPIDRSIFFSFVYEV